jgi:hypothetical protein
MFTLHLSKLQFSTSDVFLQTVCRLVAVEYVTIIQFILSTKRIKIARMAHTQGLCEFTPGNYRDLHF